MPLYYFDIEDGEDLPDLIGLELPSGEDARVHAMSIAETYLRDPVSPSSQGVRVIVRNEAGEVKDTLQPGRG